MPNCRNMGYFTTRWELLNYLVCDVEDGLVSYDVLNLGVCDVQLEHVCNELCLVSVAELCWYSAAELCWYVAMDIKNLLFHRFCCFLLFQTVCYVSMDKLSCYFIVFCPTGHYSNMFDHRKFQIDNRSLTEHKDYKKLD